jgi:lysophospholipase L1-like esterase
VATGGSEAAARALEKGKWDLMERLLDRLRTDVQSSAGKLVTALIPHGSTLKAYYTSGRDTAMAPMYELCRKYDLGCIDAAARMVRRYPDGRLDRHREELFIPDGHFSARGYDLVADAVAPSVASALGCVPEQRGRD